MTLKRWKKSRKKEMPVKNFIMDSSVVVGVGNIYASEALFLAGIRPKKYAGKVSQNQYESLAREIRNLLNKSIKNWYFWSPKIMNTMEPFLIKGIQLLLSLSFLIILHELGHYIPAKIFKTRVEKFFLFFDVKFALFNFRKDQ